MLHENERFFVEVGTFGKDKDPQYLVKNKETGVVEFCNASLYFVRDWADQMSKALVKQDWYIANPGKVHPEDADDDNIVPFPIGGGGGRSN